MILSLSIFLTVWLTACSEEGTNINGALFITSTPAGTDILVNGEPRGRTPLTVRELEPGEYEIVFRKEGFQPAQIIATVRARQITNVSSILSAERKPVPPRLAFVSNRDGAHDIWTTDGSGADAFRWTSLRWNRSPVQALLSPDSGYFALNSEEDRGVKTWLVTAPRQQQAPDASAEVRALSGDVFRVLQWSAEGRSVLLKNLVSQTIWVASVSGSISQINIPDVPRGVLTAAFAPETGFIAYADYEKTYLIGMDGTRRQELALNGKEGNTYLRFSRDGRRLVHVRMQRPNVYNAGELWLMNANGSVPRRFSLAGSQDFDPIWSRDNQKIIFVHRENAEDSLADQDPSRLISNLWVVDLSTQSLRSLTAFNGKRVRQPSISHDDQRVAFICNESGSDEVWVVDLFGGEPYPLTQDNASASFPMWLW